MRKLILYIAMSLDGFIADKNGGGIPLFPESEKELKLRFVSSEINDGVVLLIYERR